MWPGLDRVIFFQVVAAGHEACDDIIMPIMSKEPKSTTKDLNNQYLYKQGRVLCIR